MDSKKDSAADSGEFKSFYVDMFHAGFKFKVNMKKFSEVAQMMNEFWIDSESRLSLTGGSHVMAALTLIAERMAITMISKDYHKQGALKDVSEQEGFPRNLCDMVVCYYADIPNFDSSEWDVEEI